MADTAALERALVNADAAGDTEAARVLAVEITRLRSSSEPAPDKYQQTAIDERKARYPSQTENPDFASGLSNALTSDAGFLRRVRHGLTFGADDTIGAAVMTPFEMAKRGTFNPIEGYNYAKAREDLTTQKARENTGLLGTGAEILAGAGSGVGLASRGITAARYLAPEATLLARSAASAADAAGLGAFSGAMEGNGLAERGINALKGGLLGSILGGATPAALSLGGAVLSPLISNIRARINPEGFGQSQVARAAHESGLTGRDIAQRITDADAAGQGMFTAADAMGNAGQRMLATTARSPGQARTDVVEFLNNRQAGQAERVAQITDEALGASGTARQTNAQLTKTAQEQSAPYYEKALSQKPVWNDRLQEFFEDPITKQGLKHGVAVQRLESLAEGKKFNPHDYAITGFNEAGDPILSSVPNMRTINLIKKGWDNTLEGYRDSTTGRLMLDEYGRALDNVRRSFLKEVDAVNPAYGKARELYAGPAQIRDAVNMGTKAPARGRAADNIDQFNKLADPAQQGYRQGYADTVASRVERGAVGENKVRPLTSDKSIAELDRLSLHQGPVAPGQLNPLQQRLGRENTMFETRHAATGGSKTTENFADDAAMSAAPALIGQVLTGNWKGALKTALASGADALTGNTPAVRKVVADTLLTRGQNASGAAFEKMIDDTVKQIQMVQRLARSMGRGAAGGLAVTGPGQNRR